MTSLKGIEDEAKEEARYIQDDIDPLITPGSKIKPPLWEEPSIHVKEDLNEFEAALGILPLSIYAWYETIGSVNFVGTLPNTWEEDFCKTQRI